MARGESILTRTATVSADKQLPWNESRGSRAAPRGFASRRSDESTFAVDVLNKF
ncbi:similar to An12g03510 [Aspergillus luchuensis]|uniref:Similar to An12g03510 n=1 Tax=Aspergillus kawachii TaxID=1069201 RepID=A0A146FP11_ASPKA|nr:similar to An12g03510 [Aspergillus luchuensis]